MRRHTQLAITLVGDTGFVRIWHVVYVKPYAACSSVHQIDAACAMDKRLRMDWHTQSTDSVVGDSANTASSASQYVQTSQTASRTGSVLPTVFSGHLEPKTVYAAFPVGLRIGDVCHHHCAFRWNLTAVTFFLERGDSSDFNTVKGNAQRRMPGVLAGFDDAMADCHPQPRVIPVSAEYILMRGVAGNGDATHHLVDHHAVRFGVDRSGVPVA